MLQQTTKQETTFSTSPPLLNSSPDFVEQIKGILNPEQYKAVTASHEFPVCVYSGPGSGKTKTITYRIAYLTIMANIQPHNIFAMTFTNKAANEMKSRVNSLVKGYPQTRKFEEKDYCNLGTFHSVCAKILRKHANRVRRNLTNSFTILDATDQQEIISDILKNSTNSIISEFRSGRGNNMAKILAPPQVIHAISGAKNRELNASQYEDEVREELLKNPITRNYSNSYRNNITDPRKIKEAISQVFIEYERHLQENNALDFDDLLLCVVQLFERNPEVLESYGNQCKALLVDEFQDTNKIQYKIAKFLSCKYKNIYVVGDIDQNIYSWRYSDCSLMKQISNDFPTMKHVLLHQNYRSTKNILSVSDEIIEPNTSRLRNQKLTTTNNTGLPISIKELETGEEEAEFVSQQILSLIDKSDGKLGFKDFAVLIRTNAASRSFETSFGVYGIDYKVLGCFKFYDRMEVKDVIAYARMVDNLNDNIAFERCINIPKRNIGEQTIKAIKKEALSNNVSCYDIIRQVIKEKKKIKGIQAKKGFKEFIELIEGLRSLEKSSPRNVFQAIIERIEYESYLKSYEQSSAETRWENVMELLNICAEYEKKNGDGCNLTEFLHNIALVPDNFNEGETDSNDKVTISTIHSAKGLEYGIVFVCGVEEGTLPFYKAEKQAEIEEERRLLFVACTRAQSGLCLTHTQVRYRGGDCTNVRVSRFISPLRGNTYVRYSALSELVETYKQEWHKSLLFEVNRSKEKSVSNQSTTPSTPIIQTSSNTSIRRTIDHNVGIPQLSVQVAQKPSMAIRKIKNETHQQRINQNNNNIKLGSSLENAIDLSDNDDDYILKDSSTNKRTPTVKLKVQKKRK